MMDAMLWFTPVRAAWRTADVDKITERFGMPVQRLVGQGTEYALGQGPA